MTLLMLLVLAGVFFTVGLRSFVIFDRILQKEYRDHREAWANDGMPIGFFWVPEEGRVFPGSTARSRLCLEWSFSVPGWAENNSDLVQLFSAYKRYAVIEISVGIPFILGLFLLPK